MSQSAQVIQLFCLADLPTPEIRVTPDGVAARALKGGTVSLRKLNSSFWRYAFFSSATDGLTGLYGERLIEGGLLWITRRSHNRMYEDLSKPVHELLSRLEDPNLKIEEKTFASAFNRLLVLVLVHRQTSRYYFTDLYLASGDMAAFREYIYHRVASIRYLARMKLFIDQLGNLATSRHCYYLMKVLQSFDSERPFRASGAMDSLDESSSPLESQFGTQAKRERGLNRLAPKDLLEACSHELATLRLRELEAFRATLSRESPKIMASTYAGTWLAWLDRIREIDCLEMKEDFDYFAWRRDSKRRLAQVFTHCTKELDGLRRDLAHQEIEFLHEKGDWDGTLTVLMNLMGDEIAELMSSNQISQLTRGPLLLKDSTDPGSQETGTKLQKCKRWTEVFADQAGNDAISAVARGLDRMIDAVSLAEREGGVTRVVNASRRNNGVGQGRRSADRRRRDATRASDQPRRIEPAEVVNFYSLSLDFASGLAKVAGLLRWIEIENEKSTRRWAVQCLRLANSLVSKLRDLLKVLAMATDGGEGSQPAADARRYSESIQRFLRSNTDQVDLLCAFQQALSALWRRNCWCDSEKEYPRRKDSCAFEGKPTDDFRRARQAAVRLHELTRRAVFPDKRLYSVYRARSLLLLARSRYLLGIDFEHSLAQISRGIQLLADGDFASSLDRVGLLRARADCLMLYADKTIADAGNLVSRSGGAQRWSYALSFAERQLSLARAALDRASSIMIEERRRNVSWSLRVSFDFAQWSIQASLLNVIGYPVWNKFREENNRRLDRFEAVLEVGLLAVRASMDSVLRVDGSSEHGFSKEFVDAARAEWMRSAELWLSLLVVTFWHDAMKYQMMGTTNPKARRNDFDFQTLFWNHWEETSRAFRLPTVARDVREAVAEDQEAGIPALPHPNHLMAMFQAADKMWKEKNAEGLFDVRREIKDNIRTLCNNKNIRAKLKNVYAMGGRRESGGGSREEERTRT